MSPQQARWLPVLSLSTAMLLWASSFIALKIAFTGYDPMLVIWGRMLVGSFCFLFLIGKLRSIVYRPGDGKYLLFMAICEPCIYFIFEAKALQLTSASQAGLITAMLPLLVAFGAKVFLKETVTRQTMTGFAVAITGTCWLSLAADSSADAPQPLLGNFLEFMAMVAAAGYTLSLKHLSARYSPFFLTAVQCWVGAVFFALFLASPETNLPREFHPLPALAVFYLGSFVTLGAYLLFNYGVSMIPASQASAYVNLIPVIAVVLGFIVLGERFTLAQYFASMLVLFGVYLSQRRPRPL
ncbi:DMT family transporter [Desulfofustis glycolicus]|uniref:Permease of the drug/metabolite transporter (DMT) superfamily n=1 Tax=Desulfofustis glycolicus DSM 9705 TaxID=1121409 RepID=A0A1M5V6Q6_9BACT|nr:DMT family transporter [Desulfofustis glycolicus]MCB2214946.1 DMT family transporter [Desulfobulbaceae bacterium]SHH70949.1 Permease of the drug/metabolite transporter (DMT) superfamily [Desulfofustis glycolicus DSM 9705]